MASGEEGRCPAARVTSLKRETRLEKELLRRRVDVCCHLPARWAGLSN